MMTQDFPENYHDAAQFYVANRKTWFVREKKNLVLLYQFGDQ